GEPKHAQAHNNLGIALAAQGKSDEAADTLRKAITLAPDDPQCHCNLGHVLQDQGQFAEALLALRRGHELGSRLGPKWRYPSAKWVEEGERLLALDARLPRVVEQGEAASPAEQLALADLCARFKKRHADAVLLYGKAFAAEPKLARGGLGNGHRYN